MHLTRALKHTVTALTLTAFFMCPTLSFAAPSLPDTDLVAQEQTDVMLDTNADEPTVLLAEENDEPTVFLATDTDEPEEEVSAVPETPIVTETPSTGDTLPTQEMQNNARHMLLTLGSQDAVLDGTTIKMEISPEVVEGTTFLPMRFVAEKVLSATVQWDPDTQTIDITKDSTSVTLFMKTGDAYVNGKAVPISKPPFIKEGRTLVPLRFLTETFAMQIDYDAATKQINITSTGSTGGSAADTSLPPVITSLGLKQGNTIKIGETPEYDYTFQNGSNGTITNEEWTCRYVGDTDALTILPRAFFRSGEYVLSLKIQDAAGNWSPLAEQRFTVSTEVLVTEKMFKFNNPLYGETFENIDNTNFLYYTSNEDTTITKSGPTLHLSNSPEVVTKHGVLYRSVAQDDFRLFYHHLNGTSDKQYLYIIAENNELTPVTLQTLKSGVGGPGADYMNLGQVVAMRYLESGRSGTQVLQPGEKVILNQGLQAVNNNEAVTGMQDYHVDGSITISVIVGPENRPQPAYVPEVTTNVEDPFGEAVSTTNGDQANGENTETTPPAPVVPQKTPEQILREKIEYLISLPVLPSTKSQVRGVFANANYEVNIKTKGGMEKIQLGSENPGFDSWQVGKDPFTGEEMKNVGNYGVVYSINVTSSVKTGVVLNPRGGIFKGAFMGMDGKIYKAPSSSFFTGKQQRATILGVLEANKSAGFVYTPPSGSDTPVILGLIGEDSWE